MAHSPFFQPSSPHIKQISFETMEWFDALDPGCKLEAILAGHVPPSPDFRIVDHPIVCSVSPNALPYDVVTTRTPPPSPLVCSCQNGLRRIVKTFKHPPAKPITPSRYNSPSPDTTCCGLSLNLEQLEVYA